MKGKRIVFIAGIAIVLLAAGLFLYLFTPVSITPEDLLQDDTFRIEDVQWGMSEQQVRRAWRTQLKADPFSQMVPDNEKVLCSSVKINGQKAKIQFTFREDKLYLACLIVEDVALTAWPEEMLREVEQVCGPRVEDRSNERVHIWTAGTTMLQISMPTKMEGANMLIGFGLQLQYQ